LNIGVENMETKEQNCF